MSISLQQVLGYVSLTGAIQATSSGIPNKLPPKFMTTTRKTIGNTARYTRYTGERRTSPLNQYGSSAKELGLRDVGEVDVKLLHTYGKQRMNPLLFKQLRSAESYEVDSALDEVKRQVREFSVRFMNTRIATTLRVLRSGVIHWNSSGDLLPSSSDAFETQSFQVPVNNQNQLNGIITASWALNTTDIPLQLRNLRKRAARDTGWPLKYAFYGENVPSHLTQNDFVLDYLARNPVMNQKWLDNAEIPDGLFGFTWVPVYESFYEDQAGVNQDLWEGDAVTFAPEVSQEWWEWLEGSYEVPTTVNVQTDADAAMRSLKTVHGMFGYGIVSHDPPSVMNYYGDTFLPTLKNGSALYQADVTP